MTAAPLVLRNVRRLEWYVRVSVYIVLASTAFAIPVVIVASGTVGLGFVGVILLDLAHVTLDVLIAHRAIDAMRRGERLGTVLRSRTGILIGLALVTGVAAIALTLALAGSAPGPAGPAGIGLAFAVLIVLAGAVSPLLGWRGLLVITAVAVVVNLVCAAALLHVDLPWLVGYSIPTTVAISFFVGTVWLSVWMLRVLWELDELRQTAPQLAVAEERLRFSRDLHDTFGRTLSVVAVKSELAAELARRGRTEAAAAEMAEVREIAEDAGREVRAVVSGYRRPDLAQELDGARSVLESAGISCELTSTGPTPTEGTEAVLGWVVREAVTNVLRHSTARTCAIGLDTDGGSARLTVANDGATAPDTTRRGTGLIGLTERVHAAGGRLTHGQEGDRFVLTATLPVVPVPAAARPEPVRVST